jgi:hypothetical protein
VIRTFGLCSAFAFVFLSAFTCAVSFAQSNGVEVVSSKRWLLLGCGLPGDEMHRERLTTACSQIIDSIDQIGVSTSNLVVLVGDQQMHEQLARRGLKIELCTKELLQQSIAHISQHSNSHDECWIILLGHAHLYDRTSQFNIAGPDVDQKEFAAYLEKLPNIQQVLWLTFPVSGHWIKPASSPNRTVITATEADLEFTGTEMPYSLAKAISRTESILKDVDGDNRLTLFDLYVSSSLHVADQFLKQERLQTEHSLLDDNGDGRGTELQASYLKQKLESSLDPPPEGDTALQNVTASISAVPKQSPIPSGSDGWLSQRILLRP